MMILGLVLALAFADLPFSVCAQGRFAISGVPVDPRAGSVPLRRSINEIHTTGGPQWDLYIRALTSMYKMDPSNYLSYFQISGIHGKPFMEWNDAGSDQTGGWGGYCPHAEKLFVPWHRTYIILFEQLLVEHAKRLALDYPQRFRYEYAQAAETLRAPYWDWGSEHDVPRATVPSTLRIKIPNGEVLEEVDIENPLAVYKFPRLALVGGFGEFDSRNRTEVYRCQSPESYPGSGNSNIAKRPYKEWVYDAFTRSHNFSQFASTGESGVSLEQIHNGIHWDAACGEQFLSSEFTAFDPLFMLHHCNVDRLWAYWQAIVPEHGIFQIPYSGGSRFSTPQGTVIGPDSPLQPFHKTSGDFHTTRSVEKIESFGYSYTGLEYWEKTAEEMKQESKKLVNRLYGPDSSEALRLARRSGNRRIRYFLRVQLEVSEVEAPCQVKLSLGNIEVGSMVVMEQPTEGVIHGAFSIDNAMEMSRMGSSSPRQTVQMIESDLIVSIVKRDGGRIPLESVSKLQVEIEHVLVTLSSSETEFPVYGESSRTMVVLQEKKRR